jgi:hypothetical protein
MLSWLRKAGRTPSFGGRKPSSSSFASSGESPNVSQSSNPATCHAPDASFHRSAPWIAEASDSGVAIYRCGTLLRASWIMKKE